VAQEVAVTPEEQWRESALSYKRALQTVLIVLVVSNGMWLLDWWMSK